MYFRGQKYFFFSFFLKTDKTITQLFIQEHFCILGIRDHAFLSFVAGHTHQLQSAELELTTNRQE